MIYNDKEYDRICISFSSEVLLWLNALAQQHSLAVGIWIRALLTVLNRGNQMQFDELLRIFYGHNISRQKVIEILDHTHCFVTDDSGETIRCTDQALAHFLPPAARVNDGNPSLTNAFAKENFPKPLAYAPAITQQVERNYKRKKNKSNSKSSFAELCCNASTPEEQEFYLMMQENCPRICQMEEPLTYYQYQRLLYEGRPIGQLRDVLEAMENYRDLHRRYVSANLTLRHWLKTRQY